jgi:hypothetical protein
MKTILVDWSLKVEGWESLNAGERCDILEAIIQQLNDTNVMGSNFDGSIGYDVEELS